MKKAPHEPCNEENESKWRYIYFTCFIPFMVVKIQNTIKYL